MYHAHGPSGLAPLVLGRSAQQHQLTISTTCCNDSTTILYCCCTVMPSYFQFPLVYCCTDNTQQAAVQPCTAIYIAFLYSIQVLLWTGWVVGPSRRRSLGMQHRPSVSLLSPTLSQVEPPFAQQTRNNVPVATTAAALLVRIM